jgi:hypothetical protein
VDTISSFSPVTGSTKSSKLIITFNFRRNALFLFLFFNFLHLNSAYLSSHLSLISPELNFYITYFSLLFVPILLILYRRNKEDKKFSRNFTFILFLFILYSIFLTILGIKNIEYYRYYLYDTTSFWSFTLFIFIGANKVFWSDLLKVGLPILVASCFVNILGTLIINPTYQVQTTSLLEFKGADRLARIILSYETQWSLAIWPIFLFTAYQRPKWIFVLIVSVVSFVLLQQILFQKRGPSIRILLFILTFLFIIPRYLKLGISNRIIKRKKIVLFFAVILGILIGYFYLPLELLSNQFTSLVERLGGKTGHVGQTYEHGFWGVFTTENERILEVIQMFEDFGPIEMIFGKGYGGYFKEYMFFVENKSTLHIGIFNIFLKGGLIFSFLYFSLLFYAIGCFKAIKTDPMAIACVFYLILTTIFHLTEGWFYYQSNAYECMLYAASIGYLVSNKVRMKSLIKLKNNV